VFAAAKSFRKGQSPETAARRSGPRIRPREQRREKRCVGSSLADKASDTLREENTLKGVTNPKSAVGTKQTRTGCEGRKPSRG
jgi:hypothetical protein